VITTHCQIKKPLRAEFEHIAWDRVDTLACVAGPHSGERASGGYRPFRFQEELEPAVTTNFPKGFFPPAGRQTLVHTNLLAQQERHSAV
jgi:hypothetical protein